MTCMTVFPHRFLMFADCILRPLPALLVVCAGALAADVLPLVISPAIDSPEIHASSRWLWLAELLVFGLLCFGSLDWAVVHWPKYTGWVKTNETYQHILPLSGTLFHRFFKAVRSPPSVTSLVNYRLMLQTAAMRPADGKRKTLPTPPKKVRPNSHCGLKESATMLILLLCVPVTRGDVQIVHFDRWYTSATTNVTAPCQSECCAPDCKTTLPSKCVACCNEFITLLSDCNSCLVKAGCKAVPTPAPPGPVPTPTPPGPGPAVKCFPEVWCEISHFSPYVHSLVLYMNTQNICSLHVWPHSVAQCAHHMWVDFPCVSL
jgi:hypothetical protein